MVTDRSRHLYRELFGEDLEPPKFQEEDFLPTATPTGQSKSDVVDPTTVPRPGGFPYVRVAVPIDDGAA